MKVDLVANGFIFNKDRLLLIHHRKLDLWLPVGGHIDPNETPDDALEREIMEETRIKIKILNENNVPIEGATKRNLKVPFYVDVHNVGDHDHCCFHYICEAVNPEELSINKELKAFKWISKDDLSGEGIPPNVRSVGLKAFDMFEKLRKNA